MLDGLNRIYLKFEDFPVLGNIFRHLRYPLKALLFWLQPRSRKYWDRRIRLTLACPDNEHIPRVADAGRSVGGYQIMHNGLRIKLGSYYGEAFRLLLEKNRGVHEPQEERVFNEVLKYLPASATMIELGSYWAFYSMWFHQAVSRPTCLLVEPELSNMKYGQENFLANNMLGTFLQGLVSDKTAQLPDGASVFCVDDILKDYNLSQLHILHTDIQGSEYAMLQGAQQSLRENKIDYLFISTHSDALHYQCLDLLTEYSYELIAEHSVSESYSEDGLIVMRCKGVKVPQAVPIAKR
jgi:hypothetical protein